MRLRIQRRIRKALRIFGIRGLEPSALPEVVRDRSADSRLRVLAARLLSLDKRQRDPLGPLYAQMLDCDGNTALDLSNALHLDMCERPRAEVDAFAAILRTNPDETLRLAVVQVLGAVRGRASRRLMIETMEREGETLQVRSKAADTLSYQRPRRETVDSYLRCLRHPDPGVRFWAVFGLGTSTSDYPAYREIATGSLRSLTQDPGEEPSMWSVGYEARAMLAYWDREKDEEVQRDCAAAIADPGASAGLRRWAEFYHRHSGEQDGGVSRCLTYRGIRWFPR